MRAKCVLCNDPDRLASSALNLCNRCIPRDGDSMRSYIQAAHAAARKEHGLPAVVPSTPGGVKCSLCANGCTIGEGERGYCGLRRVSGGRIRSTAGTPGRGFVEWYRDSLPTNCVASWVCPAKNARGMHNLAVFYHSCTADCLFCQNFYFRRMDPGSWKKTHAAELASSANDETYCACFFGGDPASQMPHALAAGRLLAKRGVRVCWETNGTMHPKLLNRAVEITRASGGCMKFDLKAWDEEIHVALTGISNRRTLENFRVAAQAAASSGGAFLVTASTLLVPGYIDTSEVTLIARFIAGIDPHIPYTLLGFHPNFRMTDLPATSLEAAKAAEAAAREAGLERVHIGNPHLLR